MLNNSNKGSKVAELYKKVLSRSQSLIKATPQNSEIIKTTKAKAIEYHISNAVQAEAPINLEKNDRSLISNVLRVVSERQNLASVEGAAKKKLSDYLIKFRDKPVSETQKYKKHANQFDSFFLRHCENESLLLKNIESTSRSQQTTMHETSELFSINSLMSWQTRCKIRAVKGEFEFRKESCSNSLFKQIRLIQTHYRKRKVNKKKAAYDLCCFIIKVQNRAKRWVMNLVRDWFVSCIYKTELCTARWRVLHSKLVLESYFKDSLLRKKMLKLLTKSIWNNNTQTIITKIVSECNFEILRLTRMQHSILSKQGNETAPYPELQDAVNDLIGPAETDCDLLAENENREDNINNQNKQKECCEDEGNACAIELQPEIEDIMCSNLINKEEQISIAISIDVDEYNMVCEPLNSNSAKASVLKCVSEDEPDKAGIQSQIDEKIYKSSRFLDLSANEQNWNDNDCNLKSIEHETISILGEQVCSAFTHEQCQSSYISVNLGNNMWHRSSTYQIKICILSLVKQIDCLTNLKRSTGLLIKLLIKSVKNCRSKAPLLIKLAKLNARKLLAVFSHIRLCINNQIFTLRLIEPYKFGKKFGQASIEFRCFVQHTCKLLENVFFSKIETINRRFAVYSDVESKFEFTSVKMRSLDSIDSAQYDSFENFRGAISKLSLNLLTKTCRKISLRNRFRQYISINRKCKAAEVLLNPFTSLRARVNLQCFEALTSYSCIVNNKKKREFSELRAKGNDSLHLQKRMFNKRNAAFNRKVEVADILSKLIIKDDLHDKARYDLHHLFKNLNNLTGVLTQAMLRSNRLSRLMSFNKLKVMHMLWKLDMLLRKATIKSGINLFLDCHQAKIKRSQISISQIPGLLIKSKSKPKLHTEEAVRIEIACKNKKLVFPFTRTAWSVGKYIKLKSQSNIAEHQQSLHFSTVLIVKLCKFSLIRNSHFKKQTKLQPSQMLILCTEKIKRLISMHGSVLQSKHISTLKEHKKRAFFLKCIRKQYINNISITELYMTKWKKYLSTLYLKDACTTISKFYLNNYLVVKYQVENMIKEDLKSLFKSYLIFSHIKPFFREFVYDYRFHTSAQILYRLTFNRFVKRANNYSQQRIISSVFDYLESSLISLKLRVFIKKLDKLAKQSKAAEMFYALHYSKDSIYLSHSFYKWLEATFEYQ